MTPQMLLMGMKTKAPQKKLPSGDGLPYQATMQRNRDSNISTDVAVVNIQVVVDRSTTRWS